MRQVLFLFAIMLLFGPNSYAQTTTEPAQSFASGTRPLPDIPILMREVEARQRTAEAQQKDYIYHESSSLDHLDNHGAVKKTETREFEIFWLNGVRVARLLKKDGKDLSDDEKKKEDERIDKEVAKARERRDKADANGHETDSHGHDEITFSRMLALGSFSNARRQVINGRETIAVDFTGDPKAKTHNTAESVFHELAGTVWVDEQDRAISRLEGHFAANFKVGGGLLVNIRQGTHFSANFTKINNEVWLPQTVDGAGHVRYLMFFSLDGDFHSRTSEYRKFKASAKLLPNYAPAEPATAPLDKPSPEPQKPASPPP